MRVLPVPSLARLIVVAMVVAAVAVRGVKGGPNDPIADNDLGLAARACAEAHCAGQKDALGLWLTFEQVCRHDIPELRPPAAAAAAAAALPELSLSSGFVSPTYKWSPGVVGGLCSAVGVIGMLLGYKSGTSYGSRHKNYYPVA